MCLIDYVSFSSDNGTWMHIIVHIMRWILKTTHFIASCGILKTSDEWLTLLSFWNHFWQEVFAAMEHVKRMGEFGPYKNWNLYWFKFLTRGYTTIYIKCQVDPGLKDGEIRDSWIFLWPINDLDKSVTLGKLPGNLWKLPVWITVEYLENYGGI